MPVRTVVAAALLWGAWTAAAAAADPAPGGYRLGMSLEAFRALPIPGNASAALRVLCSYEPEMQTHMVGIRRHEFDVAMRAGALACIFAEPDRVSGVRSGWWQESTAPYAGQPMKWRFWFAGAASTAQQWVLIAVSAHADRDTAAEPMAAAAIEAQLVREIGAGTPLAGDDRRGLVWSIGGHRASFLVTPGDGPLQPARLCFGMLDLAAVTAINQRLAPSSMHLASLCESQP
jgi:hypothetical protein